MNDITFTVWISIVGPLGGLMLIIFACLYHKSERSDERIMRSEERNSEKWLATETKLLAVINRLEMRYANPSSPNVERTKTN